MKYIYVVIMFSLFSLFCEKKTSQITSQETSDPNSWAVSTSSASGSSTFDSIALGSSGSVYAAGAVDGLSISFGGISVSGSYFYKNPIVVKFAADGTVSWVKMINTYLGGSCSIFVDSQENVYVAGYEYTSLADTGKPMFVKYTCDGILVFHINPKFSTSSCFQSLSIDNSGNIYAAGSMGYSKSTFAGKDIIPPQTTGYDNAVLVKYSSDGTELWAKTLSSASGRSEFYSVATDAAGNIYTVGYVYGGTNTFDSIFVSGVVASGSNAVIAKYSSDGTVLWAKSASTASTNSCFNSISLDGSGNIYTSGYIGVGTFTFGQCTVSGAYSGKNSVIAKFANDGTSIWFRTADSSSSDSFFSGLTIDSSNNIYAVGSILGTGSLSFTNQLVSGTSSLSNALCAKFSADGDLKSIKTPISAGESTCFMAISVDSSEYIYNVGYISSKQAVTFNGSMAIGLYSGQNAVIYKTKY